MPGENISFKINFEKLLGFETVSIYITAAREITRHKCMNPSQCKQPQRAGGQWRLPAALLRHLEVLNVDQ